MTDRNENLIAATVDVGDALATPTVIDRSELEPARLDARWRDFCLNAEDYVAQSTRPRPAGPASVPGRD